MLFFHLMQMSPPNTQHAILWIIMKQPAAVKNSTRPSLFRIHMSRLCGSVLGHVLRVGTLENKCYLRFHRISQNTATRGVTKEHLCSLSSWYRTWSHLLPHSTDLIVKHLLSLKTLWTFFTRWSLGAGQARCSIHPPWTSGTRYSRWPLHEEQHM